MRAAVAVQRFVAERWGHAAAVHITLHIQDILTLHKAADMLCQQQPMRAKACGLMWIPRTHEGTVPAHYRVSLIRLLTWLAANADNLLNLDLTVCSFPALPCFRSVRYLGLFVTRELLSEQLASRLCTDAGKNLPALETLRLECGFDETPFNLVSSRKLCALHIKSLGTFPTRLEVPKDCRVHVEFDSWDIGWQAALCRLLRDSKSVPLHSITAHLASGAEFSGAHLALQTAAMLPDRLDLEICADELLHLDLHGSFAAVTALSIKPDIAVTDPSGDYPEGTLPYEYFLSTIHVPARFAWKELHIISLGSLEVQFQDLDAFVANLPCCVFQYKRLEGNGLLRLIVQLQARGMSFEIETHEQEYSRVESTVLRAWPSSSERPGLGMQCCCGACYECVAKLVPFDKADK